MAVERLAALTMALGELTLLAMSGQDPSGWWRIMGVALAMRLRGRLAGPGC